MWTKFIFPSFFLQSWGGTCKHATSIWSLVTSLLDSTEASWKVFPLLIFSEISETGTKNSSPPSSVTSDRTIALTMESIRCVAPSLNPVLWTVKYTVDRKRYYSVSPFLSIAKANSWAWLNISSRVMPSFRSSWPSNIARKDSVGTRQQRCCDGGEAFLLCLRLFLLLFLQHDNWNLKKLASQRNIKKKKKKNVFQSVCYSSEATSWGDGCGDRGWTIELFENFGSCDLDDDVYVQNQKNLPSNVSPHQSKNRNLLNFPIMSGLYKKISAEEVKFFIDS